jgi:transposase
MHIIENFNARMGQKYCYANSCDWNKESQKYDNTRIAIGKIEGEPLSFVPNKSFARLLGLNASETNDNEKLIITTAVAKYGERILELGNKDIEISNLGSQYKTARASFVGPAIAYGGITKRYKIDTILHNSFGKSDGNDILSLAWYLVSEGSALNNSNEWLDHFDNPRGCSISSQDITRLLDRMKIDKIMTFYKEWLVNFEQSKDLSNENDRTLYDLTSISWTGKRLDLANYGYNRDGDKLPQVNIALLCARNTSMPLFAWPLEGSISDIRTLKNTVQFLENLGYTPDCFMMDRGFSSMENISYLFSKGYTFLQAVKLNTDWIRNVVDSGRLERMSPLSKLDIDDRTYYVSTTLCHWIILQKQTKRGLVEDVVVHIPNKSLKNDEYVPDNESFKIISKHNCLVHVLFCQELVGHHRDKLMDILKAEYERLKSNEKTKVNEDLARYFKIEKPKYSRHRTVEFDYEAIYQQDKIYNGHICFITNEKTILKAEDALNEYSTRDYIEKDFDDLKNDLDMKRIRVHTDARMYGRLLIQFIAQIILRDIRMRLNESKECKKLSKTQITSCLKSIYKITFKDSHAAVKPELSKTQRAVLAALELSDTR